MTSLRVVPIVEGDGEVQALPILLRRIGLELCDSAYIEIEKPIRQPRDRIARNIEGTLSRAIELAVGKLIQKRSKPPAPPARELVLVLFDADDDPACRLGPEVHKLCRSLRPDIDSACVLPVLEFETWFVAAAQSFSDFFVDGAGESAPANPEVARCGKTWIKVNAKGRQYSETVDQAKLAGRMDLDLCRRRSPSFDKLCREIERRIALR